MVFSIVNELVTTLLTVVYVRKKRIWSDNLGTKTIVWWNRIL